MNSRFFTSALRAVREKFIGRSKAPTDRRMLFRDLSRCERIPRSKILNFYSAAPNIGNYLPVAAIHQMIGQSPDCWNVHDQEIDFAFINRSYRAVIIGGAGLLHPVFTSFWQNFADQCKLPFVIWGVGGCFPDGQKERVPLDIIKRAMPRCLGCNVRDQTTASLYEFENASITACPTILYVGENFKRKSSGNLVVFADHAELTGEMLSKKLKQLLLKKFGRHLWHTDNNQTPDCGVDDMIRIYARSRLVVTSRLHGAIIAYALRIPYVALAADEKLRAFGSRFGNGVVVDSIADLGSAMDSIPQIKIIEPECESVRAFGREAGGILKSIC